MSGSGIDIAIQIRFADVDMAGHVHNAVYLHWFELARIEMFRTFVNTEHDWSTIGLIVARNEVDHRMPIKLTDRINVRVWCQEIGNKSIDLRYAVIRNNDKNDVCAEGRSVLVCFDHAKQTSIEVPADWRKGLEKLR